MGAILGPILFVFTNDPKAGTQCTFSSLMDNTTRAVADTLKGRAAIQRAQKGWGKWAERGLMQFSDTHSLPHVGWNTPTQQERLALDG